MDKKKTSNPKSTTQNGNGSNGRRSSSKSKYCLIALGVIVVALGVAYQLVTPTIHSCEIYTPSYIDAATGIYQSFSRYIEVEGWDALKDSLVQFLKSEILNQPPFYESKVQGKKLLMIGGGYIPEFLSHAKLLGVEIYLMDDPRMEKRTSGMIKQFIPIEKFAKVSITSPETILEKAQSAGVKFDGVFTLVEDEGPLVSFIAEKLNLVGTSLEASKTARNKFKVRTVMKNAGLNTPNFWLITNEKDVEELGKTLTFPVFLKPAFGVAASYSSKAKSAQHLKDLYLEFQKEMQPSENTNSIYYWGSDMIVEELLDGPEIQLELLVHKGKIVFHCFSSEYSLSRDFLVFPVNLTDSQKNELLTLAMKTVEAVGISNGVVHVEMFYSTKKGAQLIEINNRLSRGFLPRRFTHQLLFGERLVDYFGAVIHLALGLEPPIHQRTIPPLNLAIFLDNPSLTGWETEGPCAIFFGATPKDCLDQGLKWRANQRN